MNIISWFSSTEEEKEEFLEEGSGSEDFSRYEGRGEEEFGVEEVPLTMYERGVVAQSLKNEINYWEEAMQHGEARVPERISILRNALESLERFDGTESWGPALCEKEENND